MSKRNPIISIGVGLFGLLFSLSCMSVSTSTPQTREPAQASGGSGQEEIGTYAFVNQPGCPSSETETVEGAKPRLSPLNGFSVGETAGAMKFKDPKKVPILRPFSSDGCSSAPDKKVIASGTHSGSSEKSNVWTDCCISHDISYWLGGTEAQRLEANIELGRCISKKGHALTGKVYKEVTDKFGGPFTTKSYRWGYGWNYQRKPEEVTASEKAQVRALYGPQVAEISTFLFGNSLPLLSMCSMEDPIFNKFLPQEKKIYEILNSKLKGDDIIKSVRNNDFNLEMTQFTVTLKKCQDPIVITFFKDKSKQVLVEGNCPFKDN